MAQEKSYGSFLVKKAAKKALRLTTVGQQKNWVKFLIPKIKKKKKNRDFNQKSFEKKSRNYKLEHLGNGSPPMITQFLSYRSRSLSRVFAIIPNSVSYFSNTLPMAAIEEVLPPFQGSNSEPPALFDGTARLYTTYYCPFAQRAWIARNYKGLHNKIELVAIDLDDRPLWYKEKVYPLNQVPALEHDNKVIGQSIDVIKYIDSHFEGPSLFPDDPEKLEFAEELFKFSEKCTGPLFYYLQGKTPESEVRASLDKFEEYFSKYNEEGPFLLGAEFSAPDAVYAPMMLRYHPLFLELHNYDITEGRPKLAAWLKALETVEAIKQTKWDPELNLKIFKRRNLGIV